MNTAIKTTVFAIAMFMLGACGGGAEEIAATTNTADKSAPDVSGKAEPHFEGIASKAGAPFRFQYTIIGTPIVGSPIALDLRIYSSLGAAPVEIAYSTADPSSLMLHESQPDRLLMEMAANDEYINERVTVIPQREGRIYLNVSAAAEVEGGTRSTVVAIPIAVGEISTELVEHGELETTEEGEQIRVLKND